MHKQGMEGDEAFCLFVVFVVHEKEKTKAKKKKTQYPPLQAWGLSTRVSTLKNTPLSHHNNKSIHKCISKARKVMKLFCLVVVVLNKTGQHNETWACTTSGYTST